MSGSGVLEASAPPPPGAGAGAPPASPDARRQDSGAGSGATRPPAGKWWTLIAVSVAIFMLLVDVTIVNVALPDIAADLDSTFSGLQWVIDAYALTLAAFLLTAGSLGDRIGRRTLFVVGIALFTAASLGCGLAGSPATLITFRALQGVGGAIMFATSLALLAAQYRGRDRGTAFGVYGAVSGGSSAVGPLVGGALVSGLSWRWIFFVNIPVGVVAILISVWRLRESRDPAARRIDVPGVLTFSLGLALVVFGLIRGNDQGWSSSATLVQLGAGVALLALFAVVEARSEDPMLDLSLFRLPAFVGAQVAAFTISAALFALFLYLVLYLQNVLGYSPLATGVRLLAVSSMALVLAPLAGRLTATVPLRVLIGSGLAFLTIGLLLMARVDAASTWWVLFPGLLLAGAGIGFVNAPLGALAVGVVEPARAGMASGINSTARQVGIAVGTAAFGALFTTHVSRGVGDTLDGSPLPVGARAGLDEAVTSGVVRGAVDRLPTPLRAPVEESLLATFTSGLSLIFLVAAAVAGLGSLACFVLIRQKDLRSPGAPPAGARSAPAARVAAPGTGGELLPGVGAPAADDSRSKTDRTGAVPDSDGRWLAPTVGAEEPAPAMGAVTVQNPAVGASAAATTPVTTPDPSAHDDAPAGSVDATGVSAATKATAPVGADGTAGMQQHGSTDGAPVLEVFVGGGAEPSGATAIEATIGDSTRRPGLHLVDARPEVPRAVDRADVVRGAILVGVPLGTLAVVVGRARRRRRRARVSDGS